MDLKQKTALVRGRIAELTEILHNLEKIEQSVIDIEQEIDSIDSGLPDDLEISMMAKGPEKASLQALVELDRRAFQLVDEILGPPDGEDDVASIPPPASSTRHLS